MTNYNSFPKWRAFKGITIKYSESQYSWSEDTKSQRNYLLTSTYLNGAESVYIGWTNKWFTVSEFKDFISHENYESLKTEFYNNLKNKK